MKSKIISALCAVQIAAAGPAIAADLQPERGMGSARLGAFAGARLSVPLGGGSETPRAGLTLTSSLRSAEGSRLRFARGLELGFAGSDEPHLSLSGRPVAQLVQGRTGPDGRKLGVSTLGWVAIGVGVMAVAVFTVGQLCADGEICGSE